MKPSSGEAPRYRVSVGEKCYEVTLESISHTEVQFSIEGKRYSVGVTPQFGALQSLATQAPTTLTNPVAAAPRTIPQSAAAATQKLPSNGSHGGVVAPMPGIVVSVAVKKGETVKPGQVVAVIEAMKMENNICAAHAGTVTEVLVIAGKEVELGQPLVSMAS